MYPQSPSAAPRDSSAQIARRHRELIANSRRRQRTRTAACDHDDRSSGRQMRPDLFSENFAHPPLHPVAHHRISDSARDRDAQPRSRRLVLETARIEHEMRALKSHAVSLEAQKFRASMQPVSRGEAQLRAHLPLARLLGRDRDCQARAALRTAALEHLASARRGHPCQESMSSFASAVMRLVGPFHCSGLFTRVVFRPARSVVDRVSYARPRTRNRTIPRAIEQAGRQGNAIKHETLRGFQTSPAGVTPARGIRKEKDAGRRPC